MYVNVFADSEVFLHLLHVSKDDTIIGFVLQKISKVCWYFLQESGRLTITVGCGGLYFSVCSYICLQSNVDRLIEARLSDSILESNESHHWFKLFKVVIQSYNSITRYCYCA